MEDVIGVEVERVKMIVVCRSAGTVVHWESLQRDWIIQRCCVDFPPNGELTVFLGLKMNISCLVVGHPQLHKMLAVLTLMQAPAVAVLWQSL